MRLRRCSAPCGRGEAWRKLFDLGPVAVGTLVVERVISREEPAFPGIGDGGRGIGFATT